MQPTLIWSQPWSSGPACPATRREALELEVALRAQRVARQELREPVHLAGPEGDVDEREAREDLVLERLGPAAADADHAGRVLALEAAGLAEMGDQVVVGGLADRAGVEEDQVGLRALRRLGVAERLEHAAHVLGVVLVHLAAERGHVVALGHGDGPGRGSSAVRMSGVAKANTCAPALIGPAVEHHRVPPLAVPARVGRSGWRRPQRPSYSSWRRHQKPFSLRPSGARSSHWYMPRGRRGRARRPNRCGRRRRPRARTRSRPALLV